MINAFLRCNLALGLACVLPAVMMAGDTLGTVVSDGEFRLNNSRISGSATVFDGSSIQTERAALRLNMNGTWMLLGANSAVRVGSKTVALERGTGEVSGSGAVELTARSFRVRPAGSAAAARIKLEGTNTLVVGAVNGPVDVLTAKGRLVANVKAGNTLSFTDDPAAADFFDVTGCLLWKDNHYLVVDPNGIKIAVEGPTLATLSGNSVRVQGMTTGRTVDSLQIVRASSVVRAGTGDCAAVAKTEDAQLTGPAGAAGAAAPAAAAAKPKKSNKGLVYGGVAIGAGAAVGIIVGASGGGKSNTSD